MALLHSIAWKINWTSSFNFFFCFFRLKIYYIKLLLVINTITVLYSAFEPNKEARDVNATPVPNLTIREPKAIKDNAE